MQLKEKQVRILELIKKEKLSTTKIAFLISVNYYQAESFLRELEEEKLIVSLSENSSTYWQITDEGIKFLVDKNGI